MLLVSALWRGDSRRSGFARSPAPSVSGLAILTIVVVRLTVESRITGHIPYQTLFFFDDAGLRREAAVLLAVAWRARLCASQKSIHIQPLTIAFNSAMMACSTFITFMGMEWLFGDLTALRQGPLSVRFVAGLYVMALLQYGSNSILAAIHSSLKMQEPVWRTWRKYYLWASISFFAGASAAGITAQLRTVLVYALPVHRSWP